MKRKHERERNGERKPSFDNHYGGGCFGQELLMDATAVEWRFVEVQDSG